jgi:hypothetical protein
MKTTIKSIDQFNQLATYYLQKNTADTKLNYALKKVQKQCEPVLEAYNSNLQDIAINNASVDEKGNLVHVKNEVSGAIIDYKYTKEAAIKRKNESKDLYNVEKDYPITPHILRDLPADLAEEQIEIFAGFVMEPIIDIEPV